MAIKFTVPGPPAPLQRARVSNRGGFARMHDTTANTTNKATIGMYAKQAMGKRALIDGAVHLRVTFYVQKPKSKQRKTGDKFPFVTGKPDLDNCVKLICDALNGVVWHDDKQVVALYAQKAWADYTGPATDVSVEELA